MKVTEKLDYIQTNHFQEWLKVRQKVEEEVSNSLPVFCICGKLASGLHENHCKKFRDKVTNETLNRLKHLLPHTPTTGGSNG